MNFEMLADAQAVAKEAAGVIAQEAWLAVASRGRFVIAVSGGHTPLLILNALASEQMPWDRVQVVQVHERVAPIGHPERNLTCLRDSLERVPLRSRQIHAMPVDAFDLDWAADRYIAALHRVAGSPPVLDLVQLGLGPDGHTASLLPGDPVLDIVDRDVALTAPHHGRRRMTLTYPIINRSRLVLWVVTGTDKFEMLSRLRSGDRSIPAGRVRSENSLLLADASAAGQLASR